MINLKDLMTMYKRNLTEEEEENIRKFIRVCEQGKLQEVRRLYFNAYNHIKDDINRGFLFSCVNSQYEVAKWLFSQGEINKRWEFIMNY